MNQALQEVRPHFNDEELVNLTLEGSLRSTAQSQSSNRLMQRAVPYSRGFVDCGNGASSD
jgi:hypothetical protein